MYTTCFIILKLDIEKLFKTEAVKFKGVI